MDLFEEPGTDYESQVNAGKTRSVIKNVRAKTEGQQKYLDAMHNPSTRLVFCMGPAGSGKTHCSAGAAAGFLRRGEIETIACVRPAVGAGDHMGYLPGDMGEKIGPYIRPIIAELGRYFTADDLKKRRGGDEPSIVIEAVDFMRGLTFKNHFIIVDEAQNLTFEQMKMIITRIGKGTKMIINGDESQSDLHPNARGAFEHFARAWTGRNRVAGVQTVVMTNEDIVRDEFLKELMMKWPGDPGASPAESRPPRKIGGVNGLDHFESNGGRLNGYFDPIRQEDTFAELYT